MKFTKLEIAAIKATVEKRATIKSLTQVFYDGKSIIANNMETAIEIPAKLGTGKTMINIAPLFPVLHEGNWTLNKSVLKSDEGYFSESEIPIDNFPQLMPMDGEIVAIEIATCDFVKMMDLISQGISNEETRYYLNGIYYDGKVFAATDGHRLATFDYPTAETPGIIIPKQFLKLVYMMAKGLPHTPVKLSWDGVRTKAEIGKYRLHSKLIDGKFPDYGRVIPAISKSEIKIDRAALFAAMNKITKLSTDWGKRGVRFQSAPGGIELDYASGTSAGFSNLLPAIGNLAETGFNCKYLLAMLTALKLAPEIIVNMDDGRTPARITAPEYPEFLGILMPMRV